MAITYQYSNLKDFQLNTAAITTLKNQIQIAAQYLQRDNQQVQNIGNIDQTLELLEITSSPVATEPTINPIWYHETKHMLLVTEITRK